jgi:hypothetical protein
LYDAELAMPLTVRLPPPIDQALADFCASHGLTKSQVVQQSLAEHLQRAAQPDARARAGKLENVSPAFAAFKRAGLIGSLHLGEVSATRDVVRARMASRLKKAR